MEASLDTEAAKDLVGNSEEISKDFKSVGSSQEIASEPEAAKDLVGNSEEITKDLTLVGGSQEIASEPEAAKNSEVITKDLKLVGRSQEIASELASSHARPLAFASLKDRLKDLEKSFTKPADRSADVPKAESALVPKVEEGLVHHADALDDGAIMERTRTDNWPKEHQPGLSQALERRFASLEALIGQNSDKHAKEIEVAKDKLADLDQALQVKLADLDTAWRFVLGDSGKPRLDGAKLDEVASPNNRSVTDILKKSIAESEDKRKYQLTREGSFGVDGSMKFHLQSLETSIEEKADPRVDKIVVAKENLGDLGKAVLDAANFDQHRSLEERMNSLEKLVAELTTTRFESLEALIAANAEKCSKVIGVAKEKLGDLDKAVLDCVKCDQLASLERTMNFLMKSLAETSEKVLVIKGRLESLEKLIPGTADKYDSHSSAFHHSLLSHSKRIDNLEKIENIVPDGASHAPEVFDLTEKDAKE